MPAKTAKVRGEWRSYGGLSDTALHLTLANRKMVSRQLVYRWWTKRAANGFPDYETVHVSSGETLQLFDLAKVEEWYAAYVPSTGGRPRKERVHVA